MSRPGQELDEVDPRLVGEGEVAVVALGLLSFDKLSESRKPNRADEERLTYPSVLSGSTASQPSRAAACIRTVMMLRTFALAVLTHFSSFQCGSAMALPLSASVN